MPDKLKLKKSLKQFIDPAASVSKLYYTIDVLWGGKWMPAGDENGMFKFDTAKKRDARLEELRVMQQLGR